MPSSHTPRRGTTGTQHRLVVEKAIFTITNANQSLSEIAVKCSST